jgi:hypothetical protein
MLYSNTLASTVSSHFVYASLRCGEYPMHSFAARTKYAIAPLLFAVALLTAAPAFAGAALAPPDNGTQTGADPALPENRLVTVDCENARLVDVLPDLMKSAEADYALDSPIRNVTVSLHATKVPLKDVVAAILKAASAPIQCKTTGGVFHFMPRTEPDKPAESPAEKPAPRKPGPRYNGGDPIAAATSELMLFLTSSEIVLGGRNPNAKGFGTFHSGGGSLSGSRNYSNYGFINGTFSSSSYSNPDIGTNSTNTRSNGSTGRGGH